MKVIYSTRFSCIVLSDHSIDCDGDELYIAELHSCGDWVLTMNCNVPLNIATKIFRRWHQIDQSAEPEFIARALNDALNSELVVRTLDSKGVFLESVVYWDDSEFGGDNIAYRVRVLKNIQMSVDVSVKHNITEDRVDYFIGGELKAKGWLPIIRKEITT